MWPLDVEAIPQIGMPQVGLCTENFGFGRDQVGSESEIFECQILDSNMIRNASLSGLVSQIGFEF